ncbi:APG12-domain-containing protein [Punctularia strigosozonata HHB-11173 SS5]|uniref:APG12-domain-containing protein n=1 Tax=Punctularia strigosozonata (strain HHB-11173) TaxID=741275 RepID=UPI0004416346|nr:APG12-domain-containing protein [Punctularia strigosozonata HHB-11173 SS5]EIN05618.1 APG12-domain-containing protein [Punctularia strigosozonata HHB-11173 SS5]
MQSSGNDAHSLAIPSSWTSPGDVPKEALDALETYKKKDPSKVIVRFKAVGNAPIMKQNFYKITASNRFQAVIQFLRKELGWKAGDPLFTYINLAFSPAPDDTVSNLFKSFSTDGHLIVNYRCALGLRRMPTLFDFPSSSQYHGRMGLIHLCVPQLIYNSRPKAITTRPEALHAQAESAPSTTNE